MRGLIWPSHSGWAGSSRRAFIGNSFLLYLILVAVMNGLFWSSAWVEAFGLSVLTIVLTTALLLPASVFSVVYQYVFWKRMAKVRTLHGLHALVFFVSLYALALLTCFLCSYSFYLFGLTPFLGGVGILAFASLFLYLCLSFFAFFVALPGDAISEKTAAIRYRIPSLPLFLSLYFFACAAPYVFARVPAVNAFLTSGSTRIIYKGLCCVALFAYTAYLAFHTKQKPRWAILFLLVPLCFSFIAALMLNPAYSILYIRGYNMGIEQIITGTSLESLWTELPILCAEFLALFCFWSYFPACISSRKDVLIPLYSLLFFVLLCVAFSLIFEFGQYLESITRTSAFQPTIRSLFHSKNIFGLVLFLGIFAICFIYLLTRRRLHKAFLLIVATLLEIDLFAIQCYTAFITSIVVMVALYFFALKRHIANHKRLSLAIAINLTAVISFGVVCVSVESIYSLNPFLQKLGASFQRLLTREVFSRTSKWSYALEICYGPGVFVGRTETISQNELVMYEMMYDADLLRDFHSGYFTMYASFGMVGLLVYGSILALRFRCLLELTKGHKSLLFFLSVLFLASLLICMPETYILFISLSFGTLLFTYVFVVFLPFLSRECVQ